MSYDPLTHSRHNAGDRSAKVAHEIIGLSESLVCTQLLVNSVGQLIDPRNFSNAVNQEEFYFHSYYDAPAHLKCVRAYHVVEVENA